MSQRALLHRSVRRPADPRRLLGAAIVLSLLGLALVPRVAESWTGPAVPPLAGTLAAGEGCRVTDVIDGDTLTLACRGRPAERARLTGFDAPELFSPRCGSEKAAAEAARRHLAALVRDADTLGVVRGGRDRYGRRLVALSVDGRPVSSEMIAAGLARPYDGGRRGGWCGGTGAGRTGAGRWIARGGARGTSAKWVSIGG